MDLAGLTMLAFGAMIAATGMTGLFNPEFLLHVLRLSGAGTTRLFVMASSQVSLAMGMYYILAALHNNRMFYRWSVGLRFMNFIVFISILLAFVGALVVLQQLGIYGSASIFLVVSTAGFIYAYRMFAPGQA